MDSDTPSPQDPARFSKPKSEPPILDLEAEAVSSAPQPDATKSSGAGKAEPKPPHETLRVGKAGAPRLPFGGVLGGMIGGGIIALAFLGYTKFVDTTSDHIASIETSLAAKSDQTSVTALEKQIADLQSALAESQSALATLSKKSPTPDASLAKRLAALEETIQKTPGTASSTGHAQDPYALRLALILSLRDTLRNDDDPTREIAALGATGETSTAFQDLKSGLATPLIAYDELHAELLKIMKSGAAEPSTAKEQAASSSRISSFFSQFVTVRSATVTAPKISATDISFTPLLDAIDENDANAALTAIAALPPSEQDQFKSISGELQRRATVEKAIRDLIDMTLDAIAKGDAK